jgi:hypothetical protein
MFGKCAIKIHNRRERYDNPRIGQLMPDEKCRFCEDNSGKGSGRRREGFFVYWVGAQEGLEPPTPRNGFDLGLGQAVGVASAHATHSGVLVAGMAGLVSGAIAMAAGEYVSVSSQH